MTFKYWLLKVDLSFLYSILCHDLTIVRATDYLYTTCIIPVHRLQFTVKYNDANLIYDNRT